MQQSQDTFIQLDGLQSSPIRTPIQSKLTHSPNSSRVTIVQNCRPLATAIGEAALKRA